MTMTLDGEDQKYKAGDLILVPRGSKHSFATGSGVIFEEISSTHYKNDSFYVDDSINQNEHRKTLLTYWME
jgi:N-acetylneuraminate synthase